MEKKLTRAEGDLMEQVGAITGLTGNASFSILVMQFLRNQHGVDKSYSLTKDGEFVKKTEDPPDKAPKGKTAKPKKPDDKGGGKK